MDPEIIFLYVRPTSYGVQYFDSNGIQFMPVASEVYHSGLTPVQIITYMCICVLLVVLGGITSGLNVSLLSISQLKLELFKKSVNAVDLKSLESVEKIIKDRHLLLVTLLVANAAAMEALPIFLDNLVSSYMAVIISVTAVLVFGEILPQALFSSDPISLSIRFACLVRCFQVILFPICYPIAWILDRLFTDDDHNSVRMTNKELRNLLEIQANQRILSGEITTVISGAFDLSNKTVRDTMIDFCDVITLDSNQILDYEFMCSVLKKGYSRFPVFKSNPNNIYGLLLTKELILINPDKSIPLSQCIYRKPLIVRPDENLYDVINKFQKEKTHFALVTEQVNEVILCYSQNLNLPDHVIWSGVITLEDILEDLIQEEIEDETDVAKVASSIARLFGMGIGAERYRNQCYARAARTQRRKNRHKKVLLSSDCIVNSTTHLLSENIKNENEMQYNQRFLSKSTDDIYQGNDEIIQFSSNRFNMKPIDPPHPQNLEETQRLSTIKKSKIEQYNSDYQLIDESFDNQ